VHPPQHQVTPGEVSGNEESWFVRGPVGAAMRRISGERRGLHQGRLPAIRGTLRAGQERIGQEPDRFRYAGFVGAWHRQRRIQLRVRQHHQGQAFPTQLDVASVRSVDDEGPQTDNAGTYYLCDGVALP